jgi:hypothetical protein
VEGICLTEEERAQLVDIQDVSIDPNLPAAERAKQYLEQIKDPCCFLCNGAVVRLQFDPNGGDLKTHLKNYFISCKQG